MPKKITDATIASSDYAVVRLTKVVLVSHSLTAAILEAVKKGGIVVSILNRSTDSKS